MTRKLFWDDPYCTELDTHITRVDGAVVNVAETIFFGFSGGQESDAGTIGGVKVLGASCELADIFYVMMPGHGLKEGDAVTMRIDWERRYKLMRLHFAAEIILELAYQNLPDITKVGAHIAQDKSRIDFEWTQNITTALPMLTEKAAAIVAADYPIISAFSDEANERRYWEIEGFAKVACGGTHLRRTGEVGAIALKRKNVGKGKERVEITVSD